MSVEVWTVQKILTWTTHYLEQNGDEHPRLSAEWLLSSVTGLSRVQLYTNFDKPFSSDERSHMREAIKRRANGEPLQYVTGEMPFRHLILRCEPGVLIPRPETEILVDVALEGIDEASESNDENPVRVLEVGVGTGCISLSIAAERQNTQVVATDISPKAIALATRNRDVLELQDRVLLVECDLVEGVPEEFAHSFSVFVSNPPYIPSKVLKKDVPEEVRAFEPELALDGGEDGLDTYRRLLDAAPHMLKHGGIFCVELYEGHLDEAAQIAEQQGIWKTVTIKEDLTHRPRILVAELD